jgi:hypothetical protein
MYKWHKGGCDVILEAVAHEELWIWHAFFGMVGSHSDINVLQCSDVFSNLVEGKSPLVKYVINDHSYTKGYYLTDEIYLKRATFVKIILEPTPGKRAHLLSDDVGISSAEYCVNKVFSPQG